MNKFLKKLIIGIVGVILITSGLSSCGKPKGALLWVNINNENSIVTIDDGEPVHYKDFKNPILLPPNMHKITVEYLDSGDIETKTMSLYYGYEHKITFDKYEESVVTIDSPIPSKVWVGNIDVGNIPTENRIIVHAGERELRGELIGFGYRWVEKRNFKTGEQIILQPGTDENHGALYIESETSGASLITSISDEPMRNNGSVFYPMVKPGVIEVSEQFTENVVHYINIYPGEVTKLRFIDDYKTTDKTHTFENLQIDSRTQLFVDWEIGGITRIDLKKNTKEISDLDLMKYTPFRGTGLDIKGVSKHFVSRKNGNIGVASFSYELPDVISFKYSNDKQIDMSEIELMDVQEFSATSPDGEYYHFENGIIKADGSSYIELKGFIPGSWNMETGDVLVTATASDCGLFETRVESLLGKDQLIFPQIELDDIVENEYIYKRPQGFFLDDFHVLAVLGLPDRTRIWKLSFDDLYLIKDIPKGMFNSKLFGYKYLVCNPNQDSKSFSYVVDIQTGEYTKNTNDIPDISILSNGNVISGYNHKRVSAGIIYEWINDELIPISAGLSNQ